MSLIPLRLLRAMMASPFHIISRSHWDPFVLTPTEWKFVTKMPEIMMPDLMMKSMVECYEIPKIDKNGFKVRMNIENFKPDEITVKTIDNTVIIEGKHKERQDNSGLISREFVRKYVLPDGYDPKKITSTLTSEGILKINAPAPEESVEESKEHIIQVEHVNNKK